MPKLTADQIADLADSSLAEFGRHCERVWRRRFADFRANQMRLIYEAAFEGWEYG